MTKTVSPELIANIKRNQPTTLTITSIIKGWKEALIEEFNETLANSPIVHLNLFHTSNELIAKLLPPPQLKTITIHSLSEKASEAVIALLKKDNQIETVNLDRLSYDALQHFISNFPSNKKVLVTSKFFFNDLLLLVKCLEERKRNNNGLLFLQMEPKSDLSLAEKNTIEKIERKILKLYGDNYQLWTSINNNSNALNSSTALARSIDEEYSQEKSRDTAQQTSGLLSSYSSLHAVLEAAVALEPIPRGSNTDVNSNDNILSSESVQTKRPFGQQDFTPDKRARTGALELTSNSSNADINSHNSNNNTPLNNGSQTQRISSSSSFPSTLDADKLQRRQPNLTVTPRSVALPNKPSQTTLLPSNTPTRIGPTMIEAISNGEIEDTLIIEGMEDEIADFQSVMKQFNEALAKSRFILSKNQLFSVLKRIEFRGNVNVEIIKTIKIPKYIEEVILSGGSKASLAEFNFPPKLIRLILRNLSTAADNAYEALFVKIPSRMKTVIWMTAEHFDKEQQQFGSIFAGLGRNRNQPLPQVTLFVRGSLTKPQCKQFQAIQNALLNPKKQTANPTPSSNPNNNNNTNNNNLNQTRTSATNKSDEVNEFLTGDSILSIEAQEILSAILEKLLEPIKAQLKEQRDKNAVLEAEVQELREQLQEISTQRSIVEPEASTPTSPSTPQVFF